MEQRPGWVRPVGIIAVIVGVVGIVSSASMIFLPRILEFQRDMLATFSEMQSANSEQGAPREARSEGASDGFMDDIEKMLAVPAWYSTWSVVGGVLALAISSAYLLAAIFLLQLKASGIHLFYWSAAGKIVFNSINAFVSWLATGFVGMSQAPGALAGSMVHAVLLIAVAVGSKEGFSSPPHDDA